MKPFYGGNGKVACDWLVKWVDEGLGRVVDGRWMCFWAVLRKIALNGLEANKDPKISDDPKILGSLIQMLNGIVINIGSFSVLMKLCHAVYKPKKALGKFREK